MRIAIAAAVTCLSIIGVTATAQVQAAIRQHTEIPAEPLDLALRTLAKDRGFQLIFLTENVASLQTRGAVGDLTVDEALRKLLSDSRLDYKFVDDNTVSIFPKSATGSTQSTSQNASSGSSDDARTNKEGTKKSSQDFRVAQVDQGRTTSDVPVEKKEKEKNKKTEGLEEIVVTGSRIPTTAAQQVQPVLTYTRQDIENSGQSTMGEFLNTLPDVSTSTNSSIQIGIAGMQTVQLHGLPVGTTLTLLDGQRLQTNVLGFFDLSNIPIAAVDRIEILPVGASAIYGADALAGAVNTILRKDFNGFEANATFDRAPDVNNPGVNLAWGKSWDRGSISLIGSYQERGELLGAEREPWSLTSLPANLPASAVSAFASYMCSPGNVYSVDGSNLPGLSSPEAAIPAGITGKPTIGQFVATAGKQNLCNFIRYSDITPHSQRESALLSAHYDVTESMDLFTEVLFSHGYLENQYSPQLGVQSPYGSTVAANNPYNPFGEAVNVSFAYPGAGDQENQSTSFIRPLIGLRGSVFSDWNYEVTAYFSRDQNHDIQSYSNSQLVSAALASSNPATALNPFTSGPPGTPQLLNSFLDPALDTSSLLYDDRIVSGQGILRGPVLQLPAGPLQLVIGSEYSQEKQDSIVTGGPYTGELPLLLHRTTYAVFSEARVPLLPGDTTRSPRGERLALTLAGRYDHSSDYGGKATWQSGLLWRATDTLSFSGNYGLSYKAPQLNQISGAQATYVAPLGFPDPFRGNQLISYPVTIVYGPNFNLKPETGDSFTLGLKYSSQGVPGLHTSLTWYDLKISNYIGPESFQTLLTYPSLFPGAVIREPPTSQDVQQGYLGTITQLNSTFYNFGDLRVAGFDAEIRYAIDTRAGEFTPSVALANIYKWQSAISPGAPAINTVSQATFYGVGWSPRWKGTAALAWKQGPLSMNLQGRYIGPYRDYQDFVPNNHEIGNTWIFDFNARYEVGQALASTNPWLARTYVAFGVVNLLNKIPPFSYTSEWYDLQEYDIRGRYVHLSAGVRF